MAKHADSDDEDSFVEIAERKAKIRNSEGKKEVIRTAVPSSMADVSNADTTVAECPVCATSMPDALITPCGHVFCKRCILLWLKKQANCPLCREPCTPSGLTAKPGTGRQKVRCLACHMVSFAVIPPGTRSIKCPVCEHRVDLLKSRTRYCCA